MPLVTVSPANDLEDAARSLDRVRVEIEAQDPNNLSAHNVDIPSASSIALGVVPTLAPFRDRMAALPDFELRCLDRLEDYAKAAWYLHITNLPRQAVAGGVSLVDEVATLRSKLLLWAGPLAASGKLAQAAIDKIKEGAGQKDAASDLVALVTLYRSCWDEVRTMCGVTEDDLRRGAEIGPASFALLSRQDNEPATRPEALLRIKQAWTLLDRSYQQCQRAIAYLRYSEGDAEKLTPPLRYNPGPRATRDSAKTPEGPAAPAPATPPTPPGPMPPAPTPTPATPALGGGGGPFGGK